MFTAILKFVAPYLQALTLLSIVLFVVSIALIPWLVGLLQPDYFIRRRRSKGEFLGDRSARVIAKLLVRNIIGLILFLAGVLMLFLPGQGIITIIISIAVMDFPYKRRLIQKMVAGASVRKSLNWLRRKTGKPEFLWPD